MKVQLLVEHEKTSDRPNSAIMKFKKKRSVAYDEINEHMSLNASSIKNFIGGDAISSRELHKTEETIHINCIHIVPTNYAPKVDSLDDAIYRRILLYKCKTQFWGEDKYDPTNPRHVLRDLKISEVYPSKPEYKSAWLNILLKYYKLFWTEDGGNFDKTNKKELQTETEKYKSNQDLMLKFIKNKLRKKDKKSIIEFTKLRNSIQMWWKKNTSKDKDVRDIEYEMEDRIEFANRCEKDDASYIVGWEFVDEDDE
jgi:phage/plasmid-associated DNA primase